MVRWVKNIRWFLDLPHDLRITQPSTSARHRENPATHASTRDSGRISPSASTADFLIRSNLLEMANYPCHTRASPDRFNTHAAALSNSLIRPSTSVLSQSPKLTHLLPSLQY